MSYLENLFKLKDKVAVITGGAGFLGSVFSESLAKCGVKTAILDLDREICEKKANDLSNNFAGSIGLSCDITSKKDVVKSLEQILDRFNKVDVLVNCAATSTTTIAAKIDRAMMEAFENYDLDVWKEVLSCNITGMFLCCQAYGSQMVKQGGGNIINISSIYGVVAPDQRIYPDRSKMNTPAAYSVTKGGVVMMTRYLATYWAEKRVRVNCLTLGGVFNHQDSEFVKNYANRVPMGRMAEREEVVGAMLLMASDASTYMTGHNLIVDGGWTVW